MTEKKAFMLTIGLEVSKGAIEQEVSRVIKKLLEEHAWKVDWIATKEYSPIEPWEGM